MEYDGVLIVEPAAIVDESPVGVRTLYVALSRATQRLTTVATSQAWLTGLIDDLAGNAPHARLSRALRRKVRSRGSRPSPCAAAATPSSPGRHRRARA